MNATTRSVNYHYYIRLFVSFNVCTGTWYLEERINKNTYSKRTLRLSFGANHPNWLVESCLLLATGMQFDFVIIYLWSIVLLFLIKQNISQLHINYILHTVPCTSLNLKIIFYFWEGFCPYRFFFFLFLVIVGGFQACLIKFFFLLNYNLLQLCFFLNL